MIETLHLDAEGGVGERRTSAPPSAVPDGPHHHHEHQLGDESGHQLLSRPVPGAPTSAVALELPINNNNVNPSLLSSSTAPQPLSQNQATKKSALKKKRVAFHSDQPDLYDF